MIRERFDATAPRRVLDVYETTLTRGAADYTSSRRSEVVLDGSEDSAVPQGRWGTGIPLTLPWPSKDAVAGRERSM